jgi:integrase
VILLSGQRGEPGRAERHRDRPGAAVEIHTFNEQLDQPYLLVRRQAVPHRVEGGEGATHLLGLDERLAALLELIADVGQAAFRAQELQMLAPRGVDNKHGWIHVAGREGWTPKTLQARKIPVHPRLDALLLDESTAAGARPYYFCAPPSPKYLEGGHFINVKHLNEDLQKLAKTLRIPTGRKSNGLTLHAMRHYFETQCVDSGVPQFVVDAWMGHAGHASMGRAYYGLNDAKSQAYMKQVKF